VYDLIALPIKGGRQPSFRDRHPHAVCQPLTERPGGDLHPRRGLVLGMTRCAAAPLPELFDVLHAEVVPGQEQQAVEQHAGVAGREHKPVAIWPCGILRIVTDVARPKDIDHCRRTHRHPRMARIRFLNLVYRQRADRVDRKLIDIIVSRHLFLL
jgi:hypothetical protein